jgi:tetratricopeptide (TPR) repeat protein
VIYNQAVNAARFFRDLLIILILLSLILAPRPLAGSLDREAAFHYAAAGDYARAAASYTAAAERIPWEPSLWESAGEYAWMADDTEAAFANLRMADARKALSPIGLVYLGMACRQRGDLPSAILAWKRALPLAEAYGFLGQAERQAGNFPAAVADWRASLVQEPDSAAAHYQLGLLLMATEPESALPELMQASKLNASIDPTIQGLRSELNTGLLSSDRTEHFLVAGRSLAALGDWDLAAEAFRRASLESPNSAEAWAWLGEAQQKQGLDGGPAINKALSIDADSATVQSLYGLYLQGKQQPAQALRAYQKAAELEPLNAGWQLALGGAYEQTGDLIAALAHYQRATELAPADPAVWRGLARFSQRYGTDPSGVGVPAALKLLDLTPKDWDSYDLAGQLFMDSGDMQTAEGYLKKALSLDPTQPGPAYHLALLYLQSNDPSRAFSYLNQAKTFDPTGPYGLQAARLLEQYFP